VRIDNAYQLPEGVPFTFNTDFDSKSGYLTRSILAVPMINPQGRVVGVLQLINRKRDPWVLLTTKLDSERNVMSYSRRDLALISSLASQAAVAVENSTLYEEIHRLFEGFVRAAVTAIEARDPATSGHSFRVADLTLGLAEVVDRCTTGGYAETHFSPAQMRELRYAALLHDFGKVSVRENVLVKAKKLYPNQLEIIRERFHGIASALREEDARRRLDFAIAHGADALRNAAPKFDAELADRLRNIEEALEMILASNEPTVLPEGDFKKLLEIAHLTFTRDGEREPYLRDDEVRLLSIPKGSLDDDERLQIESHVVHSYNFLRQIPWTREMRDVALIARGHHEKLDGSGYPYGITGEQIPVQTRMMTIVDIFDALAAADRPYKRAVPVERALDILAEETRAGMLDQALFRLFVEAKIFERLKKHPLPTR
jgi:HD-GYP domain-containing protein (c-di-GMP phosphodiesterase class II)